MQLKYFGSIPRPQHELLRYERGPRPGLSHGAARRTLREWPALRRQRQRRAGARELYSRADSITSLCSGKNSSKPELLVVHRGNPVATAGLGEAILLPQHDWVEQSCCHSRIG